jgi:hypothetical protein
LYKELEREKENRKRKRKKRNCAKIYESDKNQNLTSSLKFKRNYVTIPNRVPNGWLRGTC